jgi:fucose 4-O-acetylase-like acetyltransferase
MDMAETNKIKITLGSFDLLKGMSILFVILGHMMYFFDSEYLARIAPVLFLFKPLFVALMPVFFMISGYGAKAKRTAVVLKETFRGLVVPYLWVMLVFLIVYPIGNFIGYGSWPWALEVTFRYALAFVLGIPKSGHVLWGYEILHCSAVWFFLAAFVGHNLLNLILKVKKTAVQICLVAVCAVIGYLLVRRDINYYCIPQGLMALGYLYTGYILKKYNVLVRGFPSKWVFSLVVLVSVPTLIWGYMNLCLGEFTLGLLDYVGSGCISVLLIYATLHLGIREWRGLDWFRQIGVYTYWILCIHVIEDGCMQWELIIDAMPNRHAAFFCIVFLKAAILTAGCFVLKRIAQYRYRRRRARNGR